jgi:hypothetical protein
MQLLHLLRNKNQNACTQIRMTISREQYFVYFFGPSDQDQKKVSYTVFPDKIYNRLMKIGRGREQSLGAKHRTAR